MANAGAGLILLGRKQEDLDSVTSAITAATGSRDIHTAPCDLASFASIQEAARAIKKLAPRGGINVLAHLAGLTYAAPEVTDWDIAAETGFEMQMQVNLIGPALLTELLLPFLRAATPSPGRVISIGSASIQALDMGGGSFWEPPIMDDWCLGQSPGCFCIEELDRMARRPSLPMLGSSLRSNVMFAMTLKTFWTYHLAQRERAHGVSVHIFHPGFVHTRGTGAMARDTGFSSIKEMTQAQCPSVPFFYCDCTDDPAAQAYLDANCPLTTDEGSVSFTYLAAAPASEVVPQSGLLTNACEAGDAMLGYAKVFDQRLNMAARRGSDATEQWGLAVFDLITMWATGREPSHRENYAAVRADCRIRGPLGGYVNQLWAMLLALCVLVGACIMLGWCRRRCCCCAGGSKDKQPPESGASLH